MTRASVEGRGLFSDDFVTRLRVLELNTLRVKDAWAKADMEYVVMDLANALNAVYDLHEAYFPRGMKMPDEDAHYLEHGGQVAGALVGARGSRVHKLVEFARSAGYGEIPYGEGPYGGGVIWSDHVKPEPAFALRNEWYEAHVRHRAVWAPLDEAWFWFSERSPIT